MKGKVQDALNWIGRGWDRLVRRPNWGQDKPVTLADYRGFGRNDYLFLTGRVLRDRFIQTGEHDGLLRNLANNFKRFNSREIPGATVSIEWADHRFELTTDRTGLCRNRPSARSATLAPGTGYRYRRTRRSGVTVPDGDRRLATSGRC